VDEIIEIYQKAAQIKGVIFLKTKHASTPGF